MPRFERLTNDVTTTLNGAINASVTSIVVTDGSVFPSLGDFRIRIQSEIMIVTARSGNTLTVTRGSESTTAATHADGLDVRTLSTKGQWDQLLDDVFMGASSNPPHLIADGPGDTIIATDFAWINQGTATLSDTPYGGLTMAIPADTGIDQRLAYISAPSAPWVFTGHCVFGPGYTPASFDWAGFIIREASSSNFYAWRLTAGGNIIIQRFTSPTGGTTTLFNEVLSDVKCWCQIEDDNTNLIFRHSYDGVNWYDAFSHSRTTYFTTGPDQIGLLGNGGGGGDWTAHFTSFHFE